MGMRSDIRLRKNQCGLQELTDNVVLVIIYEECKISKNGPITFLKFSFSQMIFKYIKEQKNETDL